VSGPGGGSGFANSSWNPANWSASDWAHTALGGASYAPFGIGSAFATIDGTLHAFEGNKAAAAITYASAALGIVVGAGAAKAALQGGQKIAAVAAPIHHICTNKNCVSAVTGGPWTPKFEAIFQKAGMTLDDALNKVAVPGHAGRHTAEYHETVFRRLSEATDGLRGSAYTGALQTELRAMGSELQTAGTALNRLVVRR
jgi:hypothetical protein